MANIRQYAKVNFVAKKPKTVTLCGSIRRFMPTFQRLAAEYERRGWFVLSVAPIGFAAGAEVISDMEKILVDELHFRKIDACDLVHVIDACGPDDNFERYIGESTARETYYAMTKLKLVVFESKTKPTLDELATIGKIDP